MRKMINNKKGFTLIELIVVIAILAILAAVAVPKLGGFQNSAKEKRDISNVKMLNNLSQIYNADFGKYYDSANDGSTSDTGIDEFIDEMQAKDYITAEEATNLKNTINWKDSTRPTYEDTTGLVSK